MEINTFFNKTLHTKYRCSTLFALYFFSRLQKSSNKIFSFQFSTSASQKLSSYAEIFEFKFSQFNFSFLKKLLNKPSKNFQYRKLYISYIMIGFCNEGLLVHMQYVLYKYYKHTSFVNVITNYYQCIQSKKLTQYKRRNFPNVLRKCYV